MPLLVGGAPRHQPTGAHPGDVAAMQSLSAAAAGTLGAVQQLFPVNGDISATAAAAMPEAFVLLVCFDNL